ncbi:hypothetical protein DVA67_032695 [Solirubrobacter sp. CPCC 204708]|nr:hypothetical protein [Solirubrobacter deserti]
MSDHARLGRLTRRAGVLCPLMILMHVLVDDQRLSRRPAERFGRSL